MKKGLFKTLTLFKKVILILCFTLSFFVPKTSFGQDDSLHAINRKIGEEHCNYGKGDGSFRVALPQLERIIANKYNQRNLLRILPKYGCEFKLTFNGNLKTREFDIPNFEFNYFYVDYNNNPTGISLKITVEGNINNRISALKIDDISPATYDNLLSILTKTYLYRGSMSTRYEKHFVSKTKKLLVILYKNPNSTFSVEVL